MNIRKHLEELHKELRDMGYVVNMLEAGNVVPYLVVSDPNDNFDPTTIDFDENGYTLTQGEDTDYELTREDVIYYVKEFYNPKSRHTMPGEERF